jgi:hypothetical protein
MQHPRCSAHSLEAAGSDQRKFASSERARQAATPGGLSHLGAARLWNMCQLWNHKYNVPHKVVAQPCALNHVPGKSRGQRPTHTTLTAEQLNKPTNMQHRLYSATQRISVKRTQKLQGTKKLGQPVMLHSAASAPKLNSTRC